MAGRKPFAPTKAHRRKVEELASVGMPHLAICKVMGISDPTLQKYFADELAGGAARKRAEVVAMLYKSARGGNVSAQKKLEEMSRVTVASEAVNAPEVPAEKLGKKEMRKQAAHAVTGVYSPPEPPKLVVNNE